MLSLAVKVPAGGEPKRNPPAMKSQHPRIQGIAMASTQKWRKSSRKQSMKYRFCRRHNRRQGQSKAVSPELRACCLGERSRTMRRAYGRSLERTHATAAESRLSETEIRAFLQQLGHKDRKRLAGVLRAVLAAGCGQRKLEVCDQDVS